MYCLRSRTMVLVLMFTVLFSILMGRTQAATSEQYEYINISDPFLNKTPIAVPRFKSFTKSETETKSGARALEILRAGLNFTGYLKVMDSTAFLSDPAVSGIQLGQIVFKDWTSIGAELLITGGIEEIQGQVKLRLRLFDTYNTKLLVGKIYTGTPSQIRKMIHMFCAEVSKALTGNSGVFDTRLTFVSTVDGKKEIFVSEFDGYNPKQITQHQSISLSPSWSSDGRWLAYVSYAGGKPDIFMARLGEKGRAVVGYNGINISPDWMPGQLKIAATLSFSGNQQIYLLTLKGEIIKKITNSWGINVSPRFSPDGRKIAFTSSRSGTPQIYVKDLASGEVKRVTFEGVYNTSPSWSPDGQKIAYVGIDKRKINIFTIPINPEPGIPTQLTKNAGSNEDPCWSKDGNLIVFKSDREGGRAKLFVMTAVGTDQRRLISLKGEQSQPDWSK
ncbi:MAG: Tol-Pal system beta propeller repeat protein TolB [Desulfobacterales bacterium]|nr:MAG: Tol-Pal system beta propeller repeat protein TolB [Desulfobacterales bacterium]